MIATETPIPALAPVERLAGDLVPGIGVGEEVVAEVVAEVVGGLVSGGVNGV